MRALSLSQPWASVVVHGPKRIENRPITPSLMAQANSIQRSGETFAIHAAKSWDANAVAFIQRTVPDYEPPAHARGEVIGTARIDEAGGLEWWLAMARLPIDQVEWAFGPFCILLTDVRPVAAPIPCRGMLGFWHLPADVEAAVVAQIGGCR